MDWTKEELKKQLRAREEELERVEYKVDELLDYEDELEDEIKELKEEITSTSDYIFERNDIYTWKEIGEVLQQYPKRWAYFDTENDESVIIHLGVNAKNPLKSDSDTLLLNPEYKEEGE